MFCKNCGNKLNDDAKFCPSCGSPVPEIPADSGEYTAPSAEVPDDVQTGPESDDIFEAPVDVSADESSNAENIAKSNDEVPATEASDTEAPDTEAPAPKKLSKKKLCSIIAAILVVVIGIGALAGPAIVNSISKLFMSPAEYLLKVEEENMKTFADSVANYIGIAKSNMDFESGANATLTVTAGDGLMKLIESEAGSEVMPYINWIDKVNLDVNMAMSDTCLDYGLGLGINDTGIVSADVVMDYDGEAMYMTIPEINSQAVRFSFEDLDMSSGEESLQMLSAMKKLADAIPDEDIVADLLCRYVHCVTMQLTDVTQSDSTITAGSLSAESTLLTATVSEKTLTDIAKAVLTEAKNDKEFKNMVKDFAEFADYDYEEVNSELEKAIDAGLEDLNSITYDEAGEELCKINVWVDEKGNIEGLGFSAEDAEAVFASLTDGNDFANELKLRAPAMTFAIAGNGTVSGKKSNSEYVVSVNETPLLTVTTQDIIIEDFENGILNGKIIIKPSKQIGDVLNLVSDDMEPVADILSELKLEITAASKNEKENLVNLDIYTGKDLFGSISAETKATKGKGVSIPDSYVDSRSIDSWAQSVDLNAIVDSIEKAGAPESITALLRMMTSGAIASADDDYGYDEDYGYDQFETTDDFEQSFGTGTVLS